MNRTQRKVHQKQLREEARLLKEKKKRAMMEESEEMDEEMDEEEMEAMDEEEDMESMDEEKPMPKKKTMKKEMGAGEMMYVGPTSFEELDAIQQAQEQANELNHVGWSVQDLVYNIVRHPMMDPKAKSKAIQAVGSGMEKRMSQIMSGEMMHKDLDVLSIEAILAHDSRRTGVVEKALDWIEKKTLTSQARNKLSAEQFALPEKRKYPIHDKAHVRNALARAAQQIKAGGEGAADAKAALPKIRAAAKKFGIEMDTEKEKTGLLIEKDASGAWRWVGWSTNKFMDWDGEILADASHKEYTGWLDEHPDMAPVFMSWHTPETVRKSAVDFWMYENGFLIMSGALTEEEAAGLLTIQKEIDLGMSHGAIVLQRDPQNKKVITKYRMYEVSELPLENAANPFTNFDTVVKEAGMEKEKYFASLFGEEKAKKYLELTKEAEQKLEEAGVQNKEKKETPAESPSPAPAPAAQPVDRKALIDEVVKAVGEKFDIAGLNAYLAELQESAEKVPVLEDLVKALAENQDTALAEKISPPAGTFVWMQKARASQSEESKLKKGDEADEKLKKSAPMLDPVEDWLAVQTGAQPVRMQQ